MDEFSEANGNRGLKRLSEENLEVSYAILCQIQCIYEKLKFKDVDFGVIMLLSVTLAWDDS